MALIQYEPAVTEEIAASKIHIPDESDFGTGSFAMRFKRHSLPPNKTTALLISRPPHVQIAVTISPNGLVIVALGYPDGSRPIHRATFLLPLGVNQDTDHTITVGFERGHIHGALLDDMPLARHDSLQSH
jgi:hypothetical protein